jgi:hypothetical protein
MKNMLGLLVCALSILAFASTAQSGGAEASGTFTFDLGTATGTVNFAGQVNHKDGTASGQISFNATVDVSGETCQLVPQGSGDNVVLVYVCEPTGNDPENGAVMSQQTVALNFLIADMVVTNNRAAMSGTIVGDSPFAGQHTILAVENASGNDGFTWGVYKPKFVNQFATDYEFCDRGYRPPDDCGELNICPIPPTGCFVVEGPPPPDDPGAGLTYVASDYELCPYPPPTDTDNFLPAGDPHNYTCYTGAPDPNPQPAGIPIFATQTLTNADSFPLFTYPMTPIPHGGGNKLTVKDNS